ncbi:MAG: YitT family protein [Bacteroidales bacterium]|nr:YitT family protein [Bacteroidales bacterium]
MEKLFEILKTKKFWNEAFIMTVGMLITAIAIYYFLVPSQLIVGSTSGLAIVVSQLLANIGINLKVSVCLETINITLLIIAFILIGKEFGAKTVYATIVLGPMMDFLEWIYPYQNFLTEPGQTSVMGDAWFDLCCFVLLLSAAQALLFRINGSTGGLDIPAKIVNKYTHKDIGVCVTVAGVVVSCTAFFIHPFRMVVIGLIGTWMNGLVVDYFTASLNKKKKICIITQDPEPIRQFIIKELVRGCSIYEVEGGFTKERHYEIQSFLGQTEFSDLMEFIRDHKINAFISAVNVSEVYGRWFSNSYRKQLKEENEMIKND